MLSVRDSLLSRLNLPGAGAGGGGVGAITGGWAGVIQTGLGLAGEILAQRGGRARAAAAGFQAWPTTDGGDNGEIIQVGMADELAKALEWLKANGAIIVGKAVEVTKRLWRATPGWMKTALAAAAYAITFIDGDENGGVRRRRGRGLTASQIRGYWRVLKLVRSLGMSPRRSRSCPPARRRVCK